MADETKREIISWIKVIVASVICALLLNRFVIVNASVPTGSMMNTIPEKSRVVGFKLSYLLSEPKRFDIIVFPYPDDEEVLFVKRIIGMPGEKLEIKGGKVYINDSTVALDDSFIMDTPNDRDFGPINIPKDCFFMMGDNRNNSDDSRFWNNTFVEKHKIVGKLIFSYFPKFKFFN